ncbi:hypothetical protein ACEPAG_3692 [Sanghuangporus baumii]
MEPFRQSLVDAYDAPEFLRPAFFTSSKDFSAAVLGIIDRIPDRSPILGVAILLAVDDASLEALAISTTSEKIFILHTRNSPLLGGISLSEPGIGALLRGKEALLVGFDMARIAMHIRHGVNTHVRGLEITEAAPPKERNLSPGAFVKNYVDPGANAFDIDTLWDAFPCESGTDYNRLQSLAFRSWLTSRVAATLDLRYGLKQREFVDTIYLSSKYFKPIHQMLIEVEKIEAARPRVLQNDFSGTAIGENRNVVIANDRFNNRVRPSERTEVWIIDQDDRLHRGTARRANGKLTQVATRSDLGGISFKAIFVVGKDEFSHAERAREVFLLQLLQGKHDLHEPEYHLIQKLSFPNPNADERIPGKVSGAIKTGRLNQSQADVVEAMVYSEVSFVIVHGPPGTGKTSTISASLQQWIKKRDTVWVVAQSNVAVKNIAERLSKDSVPYKLLVSKEFYHEWHEHIYDDRVTDSIIRTDELPSRVQDVEVTFYGVNVILCTISTLSNPSLNDKRIFEFVPVYNLVVDEASQIGIFNYMHIFANFKRLSKVCFFGDPKQLPPFGKDAAPTLQSVFDVRHLKPTAYFLNTQYRMPVPLGRFISEAVYDGKLKSEHDVKTQSCIAFIDVSLGEEENDKKSYINKREVQTVEHLVRHYYKGKDYCIITPYDAQRNLLHKTMEAAGLRYDNIYNVDSFQGNEADYIIVSVVRSTSPGFLNSRNRVNVMLTRCKVGMVIVTSRVFMQQGNVKGTLLGEMHQYWERNYSRQNTWCDWKAVAEGKAILPGSGNGARSKRDSQLVESFNSRPRTSIRASSPDTYRSNVNLAPIRTRVSSRPIPGTASYVLSQKRAIILPATSKESSIASVTDDLRRTRLDVGFPKLPSEFETRTPRSRAPVHTYRTDTIGAYYPSLSRSPSCSRSQSLVGAWASGPPMSSQVRTPSVSGARVPSQRLTPLKKHVPSENLLVTKKNKRWEKLSLF